MLNSNNLEVSCCEGGATSTKSFLQKDLQILFEASEALGLDGKISLSIKIVLIREDHLPRILRKN